MKIKNISILGAGESGVGAALLAKKQGFTVFVSDNNKIKNTYKKILIQHQIDFEEQKHSIDKILKAELIIKSPGIPDNISIIQTILQNEITIVSEIEFASRFTNAKLICITGSNGKTTTASLIYHILKNSGLDVALVGNIGTSFAKAVAEQDREYFVIEISSFQLDGILYFKPDIAIITNITPDHLDRYNNNFNNYVDSKLRIIQNMTEKDSLIYCEDDITLKTKIKKQNTKPRLYPFSTIQTIKEGAYLDNKKILFIINKKPFTMTLEELALQGRHNTYNSMAAGIASKLLDIRKTNIKQCLSDFQNIEHRLESVATIHGIEFINDSKATNVNSTWYALESINKPIIWLAGGQDKGNDYSKLIPLVKEKVKAIICIGVDNSKLIDTFGKATEMIYETQSMEEAVKGAYSIAKDNYTVLLSPACASFDIFENYEDRGNQFKHYTRKI